MQAQSSSPHSASPLELERNDLYSDYMLYSRTEILFVLRALIKQKALITVFFDHGKNLLPTSLLAILSGDSALVFDCSRNQELNRRLLSTEHLIFTTSLDRVKIQFRLERLTETIYDGQPAFQGKLPDALLRLQRREFFRLSIPMATPVVCKIPPQEQIAEIQGEQESGLAPEQSDTKVEPMEFFLFDISGGGIGLTVPENQNNRLPVGTTFTGCQINLPGEGIITIALRVRNSFAVATPRGFHRRIGCQFVGLPGTLLTIIQRYITRIERERKARESGLE